MAVRTTRSPGWNTADPEAETEAARLELMASITFASTS